ncbi:MAG: arginine--tRNA ligase [Massiliimalia sp.]|jgi:arginyl-tRNA synthetase
MTANLLSQAEQQLKEILKNALQKAMEDEKLPQAEIPDIHVEIPADTSHGDFATNLAMVSARAFHQAPRKIAEAIESSLALDGSYFEKCEIAGPGFMNFFVSQSWFSDTVKAVAEQKENYGRSQEGEGKRVLVEFVSANPTGPMHIGNARGGAIGDCLSSALEWAGYDVTREFYVNDAGNQVNKFGMSLELRYLELYQDGIEMPEDSYHGADIIEHAKNFAAIHGDSYVNRSSEERRQALVEYALPLNIEGLERDLLKYRIRYDNWFRESTLHENGAARQVVDMLTEKGYTYEKDGAVWFKGSEFGSEDFVLVRSNGFLTYVVPDIAYHYNKLVTRGFDKAINVLGADHHGYVPRLKGALQALGIDPARLDVVLMQMVRLVRDGEVIKASKRSGKAITLATLLEEVPIDAARFFFNLRETNSTLDFDLDLAVETSSENPVYYVQYAHARICSILKKMADQGVSLKDASLCDFSLLQDPAERELIRHIALLPSEIAGAAKTYDPARITKYIITLATLFHKFYNACRVQVEDEALRDARLMLCEAVKTVLENVLRLLKIEAPESM